MRRRNDSRRKPGTSELNARSARSKPTRKDGTLSLLSTTNRSSGRSRLGLPTDRRSTRCSVARGNALRCGEKRRDCRPLPAVGRKDTQPNGDRGCGSRSLCRSPRRVLKLRFLNSPSRCGSPRGGLYGPTRPITSACTGSPTGRRVCRVRRADDWTFVRLPIRPASSSAWAVFHTGLAE